MRKDVSVLASDAFEGRGVTTRGVDRAAEYVANAFREAGLKPAGKDGSYFQPFTIPGATLGSPNAVRLDGPQGQSVALQPGAQFEPLGLSHSGTADAPLVFAGYGITASGKQLEYDDYAGVDAAGKVVIVLRDTPRADNKFLPFDGVRRREHSSLTRKMQNAVKHGAAGILFVNDRDTAASGDDLLGFGFTATGPSPANLPAVHVRREVIDRILESSLGGRLADLEQDIDRDLRPRSVELPGWTAHLRATVNRGTISAKNVVGVCEGHGPLANETVIIGAHYDHLGYGGTGSLSGLKKPAIHHGADDNGSGTTAILELARRLVAGRGANGIAAARRLVFIAFSGEELGLLGSAYYCKQPLFPLNDTAAMVNLDMVGRLRTDDKLTVYGTGTAKTFDRLIDDVNAKYGFRLHKVPGGMGPSDHASFYEKKVPVFFFFTGDHSDYHRPSDTADKINIPGMHKVVDMVQDLVGRLAAAPERPQYVKISEPRASRPEGRIPRLGIRPDYADAEEGVLLGGVTEGGPAAKAGLKEGDRIVAVGGKPVKNLEAYMSVIVQQKAGQAIELEVLRDGKKRLVKVTPE